MQIEGISNKILLSIGGVSVALLGIVGMFFIKNSQSNKRKE